jgi:DNA-binding transcriptional ArsR family regulator
MGKAVSYALSHGNHWRFTSKNPKSRSTITSLRMQSGRPHLEKRAPLACRQSVGYILSRMVQYPRARLDASFAALSDANRRGVLEQLGRADASITDLAEKFHMTLTGMKKHVGVLEQVGLVTTEKVGRVRTCKLGLRRLEEEAAWIKLRAIGPGRSRRRRHDGTQGLLPYHCS